MGARRVNLFYFFHRFSGGPAFLGRMPSVCTPLNRNLRKKSKKPTRSILRNGPQNICAQFQVLTPPNGVEDVAFVRPSLPCRGETANYLTYVRKWRFGAFFAAIMKIQAPVDRVSPRKFVGSFLGLCGDNSFLKKTGESIVVLVFWGPDMEATS